MTEYALTIGREIISRTESYEEAVQWMNDHNIRCRRGPYACVSVKCENGKWEVIA